LFKEILKFLITSFFLLNSCALAQNTDSLKVKEKKIEEKLFLLFTSQEVISSDDMDNSIVRSFGDLLKRFRVIDVTSYGIYGQPEIAAIWGGTSQLSPVFIDHIPLAGQALYFPQTGDFDLSHISFNSVERIEIFDGTVFYALGKDGGLGCLNLVEKDYGGVEPYSRATFQKGPDHYRHTMIELGRDFLNQGGFYLTGDFRKYGGRVPESSLDSRYLTGKFSYKPNPSWEMDFHALHYNTETEIPQFSDVTPDARNKEESDWVLNLKSSYQIRENSSLTFGLFYSPRNQKLKGEADFFPQEKKEKILSLKTTFEKELSHHHLVLSSLFTKESFDENENPHHSLCKGNFSAADLFQFNEKFALLLYLRGDKFGDLDPELSTGGGISCSPSTSLNLFSNLGWHHSYPSLHDLYLDLSYHGARVPAPEGRISYLKDKEIVSLNWGAKFRRKKTKVAFTTIYSRIKGDILWMEDQPQKKDTDILGFHQSLKLTPHPDFEAYLSYAYKRSRYQGSDDKFYFPFVPRHSLFCFVQYKNERFKTGLGGKVRLECEFLSSRYLEYGEEDRVPEVFILNSKFDLRFLDLHFYYVIENITDQEYRTRGEYQMEGRTHWWGFYWEFFD